jgi:GT2 family glycosyltransferase
VTVPPQVVLLGMMTKIPVAGVVWQTIHYLVGLRRLGFDVYYVESHARTPSMLMQHEDEDSSGLAAAFIDRLLRRFDLRDRWAFHALHAEGRVYGLSAGALRRLYRNAALIINLHGGTEPLPEHSESGRLVYVETDPVQLQVELHDGLESTIRFLEPHVAFFTFAENLGRGECKLPVPSEFAFRPTRQPVATEFWLGAGDDDGAFTTVASWRQAWREVEYLGERYTWSKDVEFSKFLDVPARTGRLFELALASYDEADAHLLERNGWRVRPAAELSADPDAYRAYIRRSRAEFSVAKDQNVRLRTGWFSDRGATYLASGRPVVTQDTGFGRTLPLGEGLFAFNDLGEVEEAVERIDAEYARHRRAAFAIAREFFDAEVVLTRLLDDAGVAVPRRHAGRGESTLPRDLVLAPRSRRPLELPSETLEAALALPLPAPRDEPASPPHTSIVVVTCGNIALVRLCLEAVLATTPADVEVLVVDNGSTDGTARQADDLAARDRRIRVIRNESNRGFPVAVNQGLAAALGSVLVVLNDDTVVTPGWLDRLERHLRDATVGLVGATTNHAGNEAEIETAYETYGELLDFARKRAIEAEGRLVDIPVATMFCAAFRRDVFLAVGPLDERFETGLFEDDDFSLRVREAGYRVGLAEDAYVHHFGEGTFGALVPSGEHARIFQTNRRRFEAKWGVEWRTHERRPATHYRALVDRIREVVAAELPPDATVAVVSNGDDMLLELDGRTAWHFPRLPDGTYAGYHPADSAEAIADLDELRTRGARYLVVPDTSRWWLDYYEELAAHLTEQSESVVRLEEVCTVFRLGDRVPSTVATFDSGGEDAH